MMDKEFSFLYKFINEEMLRWNNITPNTNVLPAETEREQQLIMELKKLSKEYLLSFKNDPEFKLISFFTTMLEDQVREEFCN